MNSSKLLLVLLLLAPPRVVHADDPVDLEVVHRIKAEAFRSSRVMDHLFQLTDVNGPRLTGSPGYEAAARWALQQMKDSGLENSRLEPWTGFGRGWTFSRFDIYMTKPGFALLHAVPLAWCEGTPGPVHGEVLAAPLLRADDNFSELDIATIAERISEYAALWRGKLRGRIILISQPRDFAPATEPPSKRLDGQELSQLTEAPALTPPAKPDWVPDRLPADRNKRAALLAHLPFPIDEEYWQRRQASIDPLNSFLRSEGVTAVLKVDARGAGGLLFAERAGSRQSDGPTAPPTVVVAPEHYNRLWRLTDKGIPVEVALDLNASFIQDPFLANVTGEIPGSSKKDEVVMLGAHLDSWHAGTGATDNAAGCAVMLEAMRILKALQLKMDRTVRIGLWGGEEQGLYGSSAYVREHFGDPKTMVLKPEHSHLAVYFNVDNGSGKIRGVHLQNNDMVRPIFESWLAPFKDLGATTLTLRETGGTDHLAFDAVGLPGFQFVQDPLDYGSRTHHSDLDVYDHVEPGDLMQASAIVASFAYHAATRAAMLPRKPLPNPLAPKPTASK